MLDYAKLIRLMSFLFFSRNDIASSSLIREEIGIPGNGAENEAAGVAGIRKLPWTAR